MKTWTGHWAPLTHPDGKVSLLDLVVKQGREVRWGKFGDPEYTVLHHSLLVSLIWLRAGFPPEGLAYVMLHDAHETYTGDIPSPMKKVLDAGRITEVERQLDEVILQSMNLSLPDDETRKRVNLCDQAALLMEAPFFSPPEAFEVLKDKFSPEIWELVRKVEPDFDGTIARRSAYRR